MFPCFVIGLVLLLLLPTHQIISSTLLITTPTPSLVKTSLKGILLSLRKPRENIQVCHNVSLTSQRQVTDILLTHYQLSPDCRWAVGRLVAYISGKICWPSVGRLLVDTRPTVGEQSADRRSTDGRQLTDSRPTGFLGRSSSQLPILCKSISGESYFQSPVVEFTIKSFTPQFQKCQFVSSE